jgi:hypothetical protein
MMQILCSNKEEHDGHKHEFLVTEICSGFADCGRMIHWQHGFEVTRPVWCRGVCTCGLRKYEHGPGEHK